MSNISRTAKRAFQRRKRMSDKTNLVKYIVIPDEPVEIDLSIVRCPNCNIPIGGDVGKKEHRTEAVLFADWFNNNILSDPYWGQGSQKDGQPNVLDKMIFLGEMKKALKGLDHSDPLKRVLPLGKADWERVLERLEKPSGMFRPDLMVQFLPYLLSIKHAVDEDPRLPAKAN
jgi:hypothetical protein